MKDPTLAGHSHGWSPGVCLAVCERIVLTLFQGVGALGRGDVDHQKRLQERYSLSREVLHRHPVDGLQVLRSCPAGIVRHGSLPAVPRWTSRYVQTDVTSLVPREACMGLSMSVKGAR